MRSQQKFSVLVFTLITIYTIFSISSQAVLATNKSDHSNATHQELILHYDMKSMKESDGQLLLKDISDSNITFDGVLKNQKKEELVSNEEIGFVSFEGGNSTSNSNYIEIRKGNDGSDLLNGLEDVTVSSLVNWDDDGQNRWIYGLGKVAADIENKNSYFFVTPRHSVNDAIATGVSEAGWRNETLVTGKENLTSGEWHVVTSVFSGSNNTLTLYVNGKEVATDSLQGRKLANIIDTTSDFSGFIGKSIFQNDDYFKGSIGDFRVYNYAMNEQQVKSLNDDLFNKINKLRQLAIDDAKVSLDINDFLSKHDESAEGVTDNLNLPREITHGVKVKWRSSNSKVVSHDGIVTRPRSDKVDQKVELIASLSEGELTAEKSFTINIIKEPTDQEMVEQDMKKLKIYNPDNVKGHLSLPEVGDNGTKITWESSHPDIIKGSNEAKENSKLLGWVTRPKEDTSVTLTATISKGSEKTTKNFEVIVKKQAEKPVYDAYFFAYFTGEYEGGEEISFATAEDPLYWRTLNNGQSIIQSNMGEKGLRDPFVIRSPEGDKFYMIATDLKMGESTNFDQAQITGSHSIMIWESDDLVNWSDQRMVEVAPKNGGNTWAPEAFYNEPTGEYVVYWASSMKKEDTYGKYEHGHPQGQYNVMYYATTRDFQTFSEPEVFIDEGFPTIDTTFIKHEDTFYRFTKSEVNFKVYYEKAKDIFYDKDGIKENGFQYDLIPGTRDGNLGLIGHEANNEGQTIFKDIHEDKWYLFLDSWPYHVRWTTDLEDGQQLVDNVMEESKYALPPGPRHGTVIPITREEYNALQDKYGILGPEPSEKPVVHYTFNEVEGTTVKDVSGNGHDAKLMGNAKIDDTDTIGESEGSLELDGSSAYVELPEDLIKNLNLEQATFSTWVKVNNHQSDQRIFDFASDPGRIANRNTMYLSTQGDSGQLEFSIVTPFTEKFPNKSAKLPPNYKYAVKGSRLSEEEWHHVALTIEDFDAVLYLNGEEIARNTTYNVEPRMLLNTTMNYIGKSSNDDHHLFNGKLGDFRIYNRALTNQEIVHLAGKEGSSKDKGNQSSLWKGLLGLGVISLSAAGFILFKKRKKDS